MKQSCFSALLLFAVLGGGNTAVAQGSDPWRFRQLLVENDLFSIPRSAHRDRFYTNGIRVALGKGVSLPGGAADQLPLWARPLRRFCNGCEIAPNLSFGHQIYSPEDIESSEPQIGDWPWSAWLYAGFGAAVDTSDRSRHDIEVQIGFTGEGALGKPGQRFWHGITGSPDPRGWDYQLGPDLGINSYYSFQHILKQSRGVGKLDWDFVPSITAAVGTMNTYAGIGGTVRLGRHISDFPYSPIRASERALPLTTLPQREIYGFIGASVKAVAYNYFLEGSLFSDDLYTVRPHRYVWDFTLGVTGRFGRFNITYALIRRSKEFVRTAGTDRGTHLFGTLSLTVAIR
jgi:hypothetical protein